MTGEAKKYFDNAEKYIQGQRERELQRQFKEANQPQDLNPLTAVEKLAAESSGTIGKGLNKILPGAGTALLEIFQKIDYSISDTKQAYLLNPTDENYRNLIQAYEDEGIKMDSDLGKELIGAIEDEARANLEKTKFGEERGMVKPDFMTDAEWTDYLGQKAKSDYEAGEKSKVTEIEGRITKNQMLGQQARPRAEAASEQWKYIRDTGGPDKNRDTSLIQEAMARPLEEIPLNKRQPVDLSNMTVDQFLTVNPDVLTPQKKQLFMDLTAQQTRDKSIRGQIAGDVMSTQMSPQLSQKKPEPKTMSVEDPQLKKKKRPSVSYGV